MLLKLAHSGNFSQLCGKIVDQLAVITQDDDDDIKGTAGLSEPHELIARMAKNKKYWWTRGQIHPFRARTLWMQSPTKADQNRPAPAATRTKRPARST